jgi:tRNA(fMet)-specific endonuclease VapC
LRTGWNSYVAIHMLDTNVASALIKGKDATVLDHLAKMAVGEVVISVVTDAELRYGLIKCGSPEGLSMRIHAFLQRIEVVEWNSVVAQTYGECRTKWEAKGISLSAFDLLIAAHAVAVNAILVSCDNAFSRCGAPLRLKRWR